MGVFLRVEISERSKLNEAPHNDAAGQAAECCLWSFNPIPPVFVRKIGLQVHPALPRSAGIH